MAHMMRISSRAIQRLSFLSARASSSATPATSPITDDELQLNAARKEEIHPKIGAREIVGWGFNGEANYVDKEEYPCPAIRFKEDNAEIAALRMKEKGDWKALTLEEKKTLYRAEFCQTYAEMLAPTGEWKVLIAGILLGFIAAGWLAIWMKTYVYRPLPRTLTKEWKDDTLKLMIDQRVGAIHGISSKWDYEKGQWK